MGKKDLFDDGDESVPVGNLIVNEAYAKRLQYNHERQELQRLKDKYGKEGEDDSDEGSSAYSTEDSDGEEVTPAVDATIFRILDRLKSGDESLYNVESNFFEEEEQKLATKAPKKSTKVETDAPVKLKEYQLKSLLNEANGTHENREEEPKIMTNEEESRALKAETIAAFHSAVANESEEHEEDLLTLRTKSKQEKESEDNEYRKFLDEVVGGESLERALQFYDDEKSIGSKKKKRSKQQQEEELFLREFIINRKWMENKRVSLPTYDEIMDSDKREEEGPTGANAIAVSHQTRIDTRFDDEDDNFVDKADAFEEKYNFRFEEPGADNIQTHARDVDSTRRKDDSRSQKRKQREERKAQEKEQKKKDLERLKELKQKEIMQKLESLKMKIGNDAVDFSHLDLDADFDDTYDSQMAKVFDDEYFNTEDPGMKFDEDGKPFWDDEIDIADLGIEEDNEEGPINTDADFLPGGDAYDPTASKTKQKKTRKEKQNNDIEETEDFEKVIKELKKRKRDGEDVDEELERYENEYYNMEHEDIVGDIPTRFKYKKVKADYFDLTPVEILMATDAELNTYVGPRKLASYRDDADNVHVRSRKKKLKTLRKALENRQWGQEDEATNWKRGMGRAKFQNRATGQMGQDNDGNSLPKKKRMGKNERMKKKAQMANNDDGDGDEQNAEEDLET